MYRKRLQVSLTIDKISVAWYWPLDINCAVQMCPLGILDLIVSVHSCPQMSWLSTLCPLPSTDELGFNNGSSWTQLHAFSTSLLWTYIIHCSGKFVGSLYVIISCRQIRSWMSKCLVLVIDVHPSHPLQSINLYRLSIVVRGNHSIRIKKALNLTIR